MDTGRRKTERRQAFLTAFHPLHGLAFLAGLLAVYILPALPPWPLWLAALIPLALYQRFPFMTGLWGAALLGGLWLAWAAQQRLEAQWPEARHGEDVWLQGRISEIPERRGGHWRFYFAAESSEELQSGGLVRTTWYRSDAQLAAGQCWRLRLRMRTPRGSLNPGGFDYEGWLFRQDIIATAYVKAAEPCEAGARSAVSLLRWRQHWQRQISAALDGHPMQPVVLALSLGIRERFSQSDWDLLRRTGTSHLMAISGLHIGLIAAWLYFLGYRAWRLSPWLLQQLPAPRAAILLSALGAVAYALLSGYGLPAQRALVMLLVFYFALWSGRQVAAGHGLAVALVAVLLVDPFAVGSAGFWLSFAAVAWIFYLLARRWRAPGKLVAFLYIQMYLSLALIPLTLYWFGQASWAAPFVNLLLIPVFTVLIPLLFVAVLCMVAVPPAGDSLLILLADALAYIWQWLGWVDKQWAPVVSMPATEVWMAVLALAGLLWFSAPRGWPARSCGLLLCLPLALGSKPDIDGQSLRLAVLDVGQGLSTVVETANHVLIYDAGPAYSGGFDAGAMVVLPYLRSRGHERIDTLVQSHGDLDHRGGMDAIRSAMPYDRVYGTGKAPCRAGMAWQWDGVRFRFLHPDNGAWQGNNSSCVLKISAGSYSALLTGDIEAAVERHLIRNSPQLLDADVLVAPHHGSASSSSRAFVERVSPRISLFSAGWRNRWDFPRKEVLARYRVQGSRVFSTAAQGAVLVRISARDGVTEPVVWRQQVRRLWHNGEADWP